MQDISLSSEDRRFVEARVASGEFRSASAVMHKALRLLRQAERDRERFTAMLEAARERADREGTFSVEEVEAELIAVIEAAQRRA